MSEWKPRNLEEALEDAIGSAINDNSTQIESYDEFLSAKYFNKTVTDAIKNIKAIKELIMKWEVNNERTRQNQRT